jgi:hypothetical protein
MKKTFLVIALCFALNNLSAQSLMHSFGANISVITGTTGNQYNSSNYTMSQTMLSYFPRYNFVENDNSSISLGAPLGIGFGIASNSYDEDYGLSFAYDLPLVLDYNIGCKSTPDNEGTFGGYFGAGFGYSSVAVSKSASSDFKGKSIGPIFRGGVRIGSNNEAWGGHAITVGLFYKKGINEGAFQTFGCNVLYDL